MPEQQEVEVAELPCNPDGTISHRTVREWLKLVAQAKGEVCGIPMPIEGQKLVVEPSHPMAETLALLLNAPAPEDPDDKKWTLVNQWWSRGKGAYVYVWDYEGTRMAFKRYKPHSLKQQLETLGCSHVWGLEQEGNALKLLSEMLRPHNFNQYVMTGMFLERSEKSGVTYLFRRLRPTLACTATKDDDMKMIAALCMHPIAYYQGTWAGAMCPTDDVIAHLAMMRGDEHMFWKRCNQHSPLVPEAGL